MFTRIIHRMPAAVPSNLALTTTMLLALLATGTACSQSSLVGVSRAPSPPSDQKVVSLPDDPWEALESFRIDEFLERESESDLIDFANALQAIEHNDWARGEQISCGLMSAQDARVRPAAERVCLELPALQENWERLAKFDPSASLAADPDVVTTIALAKALRSQPRETRSLPGGETEVVGGRNMFGLFEARVQINGRTYDFVLDTGASMTVVGSKVAKAAELPTVGSSISVGTSTNQRVDLIPTLVKQLQMGSLKIENHPATIIDSDNLSFGPLTIDGIIGWPILMDYRFELDWDNDSITIREASCCPSSQQNFFWLGYPVVRGSAPSGVPLYFGLDTGAVSTSLRRAIQEKAPLKVTQQGRGLRMGAGGSEQVDRYSVDSFALHLGDLRFQFEDISMRDKNSTVFLQMDGQLGIDLVREGRMIIDFPNGFFGIEKDS